MNETRQRIVNAANGAFRTRAHWRYAEIRPIPLNTFDQVMDGKDVDITTDCSGLATCCYHRAGAPDPNGQGYDTHRTMFTGTMLEHLPAIPLSKARPGDLAVFGEYPGKHVVIILAEGANPMCISHGSPGDPKLAPLSHFMPIGPLTVLRGVPRLPRRRKHRPAHRPRWIVSGDHGKVIGRVKRTRFRWWLNHHRTVKHQVDEILFKRVRPRTNRTANAPVDR